MRRSTIAFGGLGFVIGAGGFGNAFTDLAFIGLIIVGSIIYLWNFAAAGVENAVTVLVVGSAFVAPLLAPLLALRLFRLHRIKGFRKIALGLASLHARELHTMQAQAIETDRYGKRIYAKYNDELNYFIDSMVRPKLGSRLSQMPKRWRARANEAFYDDINAYVFEVIVPHFAEAARASGAIPNDPIAFEEWCADVFRKAGWEARTTKRSGDQGSDIIMTKGGRKMVVQCKLYSSPVGNDAVQQVSAARMHEGADLAAVVALRGYTNSAKQLAATNNVYLLDAAAIATATGSLPN
jgi:restriction system protein